MFYGPTTLEMKGKQVGIAHTSAECVANYFHDAGGGKRNEGPAAIKKDLGKVGEEEEGEEDDA